jgi:type II secretory pathway component GspD/PulD (secretin)
MGVLLGATLAPAAAPASVPVSLLNHVAATVPAQTESRLTRAHSALNAAIDSQRQGNYEQADVLFKEAQARQADLTPDERVDLANRMKANAAALEARKEGSEQLQKAEAAYKAGRTSEAETFLKKVIANSSLSQADRKKATQLAAQIRPRGGDAAPTPAKDSLAVARAKVQQARALLTRVDIDGAEQIALEVKRMNVTFTATEDSPQKLLTDIGQLRNDPQALLAAARNACERGDYDRAEQYARLAQKKESVWTVHLRGDSPAKVLKDVQAGRAKATQATTVVQNTKPIDSPKSKDTTTMPSKMDVTPKPATPVATVTSKKDKPEDVPALMQQAKDLMAAGQLDEAARVAQRARNAQVQRTGWGASWQLFEDTPEKLLKEIYKAKHQRDQEESVKVLAEGRRLLDQGDLEAASKCAYKAESLHGPYSIMELGDRPHKLLADVQAAQEKRRKSGLPSTNMTASAKPKEDSTTPPLPGMAPKGSIGPDLSSPYASKPAATPAMAKDLTPPKPGADAMKMRAQALLSDARELQREGKLVEARQKVVECQRLGVVYGPDEDRPEQVMVQLIALAGKKIDSLMGEAEDCLATGAGNGERCTRAESNLVQARQIAVSFGLDTFRVDTKLGQARQAVAQAKGGPVAPLPPPVAVGYQPGQATASDMNSVPAAPAGVGQELLQKARLELRSGHTEVARRIAEEAIRGNYGVKMEAEAILRDVTREEYNQNVLTANRTFEAGQQAFNRHDYVQAAAIFRTLDVHLLDPAKQGRLKEYMGIPEMQPRAIQQTAAVAPPTAPGVAQATDTNPTPQPRQISPEASFANQVQALQDVRFQELREEGRTTQQTAMEQFRAGDSAAALETLQEYLGKLTLQVGGGQMDPERVALLRQPIENRLKQLKTLKAQQDFEHEQNAGREAAAHGKTMKEMEKQARQKQIAELMKRYNDLYHNAKYDDAEVVALQAKELEPDNPIITAAVSMAHMHRNVSEAQRIKDAKAEQWLTSTNDAEKVGPPVTSDKPEMFDPNFKTRTQKRGDLTNILIGKKSRSEQEIEHRLLAPVSMKFENQPLGTVLYDIQKWHGINIVPDQTALSESLISLEQPVSITLDNIPLKSALNLILRNAKLTYVIRDDVVQVTTEKNAHGKLVQKVYQVTDLVTPLLNATMPINPGLPHGIRASEAQPNTMATPSGVQPYNPNFGLNNGQQVSATGSMADALGHPSQRRDDVVKTATKDTIEDQLIGLIKNTIHPETWNDAGGPGSLEYFPLTQALVVNQTPDIQEQVQDLLSALRRLQDQEVAIEVRFITVAESFYERMGMDFNINIKTDQITRRWEPLLTTGNFKPGQQVNDFSPDRFISGLTPAGTFTSDLDIPIKSTSFGLAIPPFGAFPNLPGGNGGIDLGLAFLSDIQVFLFMEAAQGDARTHVMQAPKLTMFNGQTANIFVTDSQFFTTDVNTFIVGSQIAFAPVNTLFPTGGITMFVRAAISGDRRFVRLDMTPTLHNLASAVVPLIPVVTPIFPASFEGGQVQNPVIFTQFIQQPVFNTIMVMTSVAVPDGGTILMGGLKRLSEGRNEFGPPILSKIPYINRLFRNVGYGREVESLLMMVTPRIIIQEEEEERQTGLTRERLTGQ